MLSTIIVGSFRGNFYKKKTANKLQKLTACGHILIDYNNEMCNKKNP